MCGKSTQYRAVPVSIEHAAALISGEAATQARQKAAKAFAPIAALVGPELFVRVMAQYESDLTEALLDYDSDAVGELLLAQEAEEEKTAAQVEEDHAQALDEDFVREVAKGLRNDGLGVEMAEVDGGYALTVKVG